MGLVFAYAVVALILLALAGGLYTPKKWRELSAKHVKFLKFGCLFGSLLILFNVVMRYIELR